MARIVKRKVFYSFHYDPDNWRAQQIRQIGVIEGNQPTTPNNWEKVRQGGDKAIKRWIDGQMHGRSCTVVLIGSNTAGRKYIDYEIKKSWNSGMGVVGIYVHGLQDSEEKTSNKGANPFAAHTFNESATKLSSVAKCYDPQGRTSQERYDWIKKNLSAIVEEAIKIRKDFKGV